MAKKSKSVNTPLGCYYDLVHFAYKDDLGIYTAVYFCTQWYSKDIIIDVLTNMINDLQDVKVRLFEGVIGKEQQ